MWTTGSKVGLASSATSAVATHLFQVYAVLLSLLAIGSRPPRPTDPTAGNIVGETDLLTAMMALSAVVEAWRRL